MIVVLLLCCFCFFVAAIGGYSFHIRDKKVEDHNAIDKILWPLVEALGWDEVAISDNSLGTFTASASQHNLEIWIDIRVKKNEDFVTGFKMIITHNEMHKVSLGHIADTAGFTLNSLSNTKTELVFSGRGFGGQNELLVQFRLRVCLDTTEDFDGTTEIGGVDESCFTNKFAGIQSNEITIEVISFTLEKSPLPLLNIPVIVPDFKFNSYSAVCFENYTFRDYDGDSTEEDVSMSAYLLTNHDVKTQLEFVVALETTTGAYVPSTMQIQWPDWDFEVTKDQPLIDGVGLNGFKLTATKIPSVSSTKQLICKFMYRRIKNKPFSEKNLFSIIKVLQPTGLLDPYPTATENEIYVESDHHRRDFIDIS